MPNLFLNDIKQPLRIWYPKDQAFGRLDKNSLKVFIDILQNLKIKILIFLHHLDCQCDLENHDFQSAFHYNKD